MLNYFWVGQKFVGTYRVNVEGQLLDNILGNILKENIPIAFLILLFLVHLSLLLVVCFLHRSYDTFVDNTDKASINLVDIKVQSAKWNLGSLVAASISYLKQIHFFNKKSFS